LDELLYLALVYVLAAVPFGIVVTTLYGVDGDLRASGSGNIGATNVARVFGWRIALPVLLLDMGKGLLPVLATRLLWPELWPWFGGLVGAVAFIGHCWPVYLEFRGGKGVATGAGAFLGLAPLPTALAAVVWGVVLAATGRSSVAALVATLALVGLVAKLAPEVAAVAALLAIGVAIRHIPNIGRLVRGEEGTVVKPAVRWGRAAPPTAEEALGQGPGGAPIAADGWKD
jgi:acyl phosphate:glycerol-3-phosphate acyltransferase